jgi:hypothetical protein
MQIKDVVTGWACSSWGRQGMNIDFWWGTFRAMSGKWKGDRRMTLT